MAWPKEKAATRRKEILENFYAVLASEGLEGASIAKIADRMGVNPSLIIHYFSTKEEMVVALVDHILAMYESVFLPRLREIEDPQERLEAAADGFFGADWAGLVDPGVFYACYSLGFRNPRVKESFRKMYGKLRGVLTEEIAALIEAGVVPGGDSGKLAGLVIAVLEGYDFYRCMLDEGEADEFGRFCRESLLAVLRGRYAGN